MKQYEQFFVTGAYFSVHLDQMEEIYEEDILAKNYLGAFRQSIYSGVKGIYHFFSIKEKKDFKTFPIADWLNWNIVQSEYHLFAEFKNYRVVVNFVRLPRPLIRKMLNKESVSDAEILGELF